MINFTVMDERDRQFLRDIVEGEDMTIEEAVILAYMAGENSVKRRFSGLIGDLVHSIMGGEEH
jgi:hypothetical protein